MTFANEVPLPGPVSGNSGFTADFARRGPRDAKGRRLRDFDLKTRLFRYPLSYMIYSTAFDALKPDIRDKLYRRLYDALQSQRRRRRAMPSPSWPPPSRACRITGNEHQPRIIPAPGHYIIHDEHTGKVSYWQSEYHQSAADRHGVSTADYIHAMYFFLMQARRAMC